MIQYVSLISVAQLGENSCTNSWCLDIPECLNPQKRKRWSCLTYLCIVTFKSHVCILLCQQKNVLGVLLAAGYNYFDMPVVWYILICISAVFMMWEMGRVNGIWLLERLFSLFCFSRHIEQHSVCLCDMLVNCTIVGWKKKQFTCIPALKWTKKWLKPVNFTFHLLLDIKYNDQSNKKKITTVKHLSVENLFLTVVFRDV